MSASSSNIYALQPEIDRLVQRGGRRIESGALNQAAMKLGGYEGPRWRIDRRKQPLRSRRGHQRVLTHLRREAVIRLRLAGHSFRQIGRELGVSQVSAWKLWRQVVEDLGERAKAERIGWGMLHAAVSAAVSE